MAGLDAAGAGKTGADEAALERKQAVLAAILRECGSVVIGYSGGVDSVFLARFALDVLGRERVLAVTGASESYPRVQREMAQECVQRFGIPHLEIGTGELADPSYLANPSNRCYFCKTELWERLGEVARERGFAAVLDGSNADDAGDYRPGLQAAKEHAVRSPLMEAALSKAEIRLLSARLGLPTWDQPASPCLSSRLPYGLAVTVERLRQVERAEELLRARGLVEFRVRHHGDVARIEAGAPESARVAAEAAAIGRELGALGFGKVLLDVEGYRRGALNEGLGLVPLTRARDADVSASSRGARGAA